MEYAVRPEVGIAICILSICQAKHTPYICIPMYIYGRQIGHDAYRCDGHPYRWFVPRYFLSALLTASSLPSSSPSTYYCDVIMDTMASQITSLATVYSTVYSDADQRTHQSSASLAFVWGIHRGPVNSPDKWPVTRKMFPFDDVIMNMSDFVIKGNANSLTLSFQATEYHVNHPNIVSPKYSEHTSHGLSVDF